MAKYVYPAIVTLEEEGGYSVYFPELEGCFTQGDSLAEALLFAQEALALMLVDWNGPIPDPGSNCEVFLSEGWINWIACDTDKVDV